MIRAQITQLKNEFSAFSTQERLLHSICHVLRVFDLFGICHHPAGEQCCFFNRLWFKRISLCMAGNRAAQPACRRPL